MANYLKTDKKQQIYGLLQLGWSYRRIEKETGGGAVYGHIKLHRFWSFKSAPPGAELQSFREVDHRRLEEGLDVWEGDLGERQGHALPRYEL